MVKNSSSANSEFCDKKLAGNISQAIMQKVRDFEFCFCQLELKENDMRDLFTNVVSGTARNLFFENCRDDMNFGPFAKVMVDEINFDFSRLSVQLELKTLIMDRLIQVNGITAEG